MADRLTVKQKEEFQKAFDMFKDDNGNIPNGKLYTIMKSLGQNIPDAELELMIQDVDADDSGEIDIYEFFGMMASNLGLDDPYKVKDAFRCMDNETQGMITIDDLLFVIGDLKDKLSEEKMVSIFLELDPDGSGKVDLRRFKKVFRF